MFNSNITAWDTSRATSMDSMVCVLLAKMIIDKPLADFV